MPPNPKYSQPEIERRWLVQSNVAEQLASDRTRLIEDRYIHGTQLRLRIVQEEGAEPIYKLGKKYDKNGMDQPVVSIYLTETEYETLSQLPARIARKRRLSIAGGSLDIYAFPKHPFAIFEIEFVSAEEAAAQFR
jgi:CYTH domain-containing protein